MTIGGRVVGRGLDGGKVGLSTSALSGITENKKRMKKHCFVCMSILKATTRQHLKMSIVVITMIKNEMNTKINIQMID